MPGDPLAGFMLASGRLGWGVAWCIAAALLLYAAGLLLNDFFDRHVDARERPKRPIPSGDVGPAAVAAAGAALLVAGTLVGWIGCRPGGRWVPITLAAAILAYDTGLKRLGWVGPVVMGSCRAGSIVLGAACAGRWASQPALVAAVTLWAYTAAVTHLAAGEARARRRGPESLVPGVALLVGGVVLWMVRCPATVLGVLGPLALLAAAGEAVMVARLLMRGLRPVPQCIGRLVRVMVSAQAGWCLWRSSGGLAVGVAVSFVALRLGAEAAGRSFYGS